MSKQEHMTIAEYKARQSKGKKRGEMNKLEAAFESEHLSPMKLGGHYVSYKYESVKLRLANGAWFTPDFYCNSFGGGRIFFEVKGFWREAARVRIKVAAELYPEYRFIAVQKIKGEWKFEEF